VSYGHVLADDRGVIVTDMHDGTVLDIAAGAD
jgi:hypothetical protein